MIPPLLPPVLFGVVVLGLMVHRRRRRSAARRLAVLETGLDSSIDLIAVVLGSGGTIRDGVATVAALGPGPV
ncbi:MAG: hypothetical protein ACR2QK_06470, partial [Acidimicrobiales bacterium]